MFVFLQLTLSSQTNSGLQQSPAQTLKQQKAPVSKTIKIKGQVINSKSKKPIQGAIIMIVGTATGTITNAKGNFIIEIPEGAKQLSFSADKYSPIKVAVDTTKEMTVNLSPKSK
jgi:hypothetical protein